MAFSCLFYGMFVCYYNECSNGASPPRPLPQGDWNPYQVLLLFSSCMNWWALNIFPRIEEKTAVVLGTLHPLGSPGRDEVLCVNGFLQIANFCMAVLGVGISKLRNVCLPGMHLASCQQGPLRSSCILSRMLTQDLSPWKTPVQYLKASYWTFGFSEPSVKHGDHLLMVLSKTATLLVKS